ncbi:IS3 family transposase, partial [Lactiplantibacillus pentosus]
LEHDELITFRVTHKMVRRVMRELGLRCQIRVKKHSRQEASEQYVQDNILNQNFETDAPNKVWLSDSTELSFGPNGEYKIRLSG